MSKSAKTICLFSPKGGVGKTIIAMNLAGLLSKRNEKVLLVDFDVFNGGLSMLINENITKTIYQLTDDLINNRYKEINDYVYNYNESLDILCAPKDPRQGSKIDSKYIDLILEKASLNYSYIIIDTSSVLDEINLVALDYSDEILFVTSSDLMSLKNLRNVINIFKDYEINNYKVILNSSFNFINPYFSLQEIKKIIGTNVDYTFTNTFFIKDITKILYDNKIPVLDNYIAKKYKSDINKLNIIIQDLVGGNDEEK